MHPLAARAAASVLRRATALAAAPLVGALVAGCAAVGGPGGGSGGGSGGALPSEDASGADRSARPMFLAEGSDHAFEAVLGALDSGAFRTRPDEIETLAASLPPTRFALAGVGFPHVENLPSADLRDHRRYRRMLDWRHPASVSGRARPRPRIHCMNLPSRVVARRAAPYVPTIERLSGEYGVDATLVKALIARESCFDPDAVSRVGAIGLMQLMPETARELNAGDPFKPANNLRAGIRYLAELHLMFGGNVELALAAYNAGPGNVRRYGGIPPFAETEAYVVKVLAYQRRYRALELVASL